MTNGTDTRRAKAKATKETYRQFLESKITLTERSGFDIEIDNPMLFGHQQVAARWALGLGRALIAASFGLGKTRIQCELASQVYQHTGKRFLVVCPLGVRHQFTAEDGPAMGQVWQYVRNDGEVDAAHVNAMLCLNADQTKRGEQNHICPLPFDIVKRVITLYSNPGDLVLDPFAGLGTVPYIAMKLGRRAVGIELKQEYFDAMVHYCQEMEQEMMAPTLFDYLKMVEREDNGD